MKLKDYIVWLIISFAIYGLWLGLELLMYGEIQPRKVDNIIGMILCISLYINYKQHEIINKMINQKGN